MTSCDIFRMIKDALLRIEAISVDNPRQRASLVVKICSSFSVTMRRDANDRHGRKRLRPKHSASWRGE